MKDIFGLAKYKWAQKQKTFPEFIHLSKLSVTQQTEEEGNQGEAFPGGRFVTSELKDEFTRIW